MCSNHIKVYLLLYSSFAKSYSHMGRIACSKLIEAGILYPINVAFNNSSQYKDNYE